MRPLLAAERFLFSVVFGILKKPLLAQQRLSDSQLVLPISPLGR